MLIQEIKYWPDWSFNNINAIRKKLKWVDTKIHELLSLYVEDSIHANICGTVKDLIEVSNTAMLGVFPLCKL